MKRKRISKAILVLTLTGLILSHSVTAMAANTTTNSPEVARTKAWDSIKNTLGGMPESVRKIEYSGSVFYLGEDVTDTDFLTVLEVGPEAVRLKPPVENGKLYAYPVYIVWSGDKTTLLVHPITFDYEAVIEDVAIPTLYPESPVSSTADSPTQKTEAYMLSDEYADAVRTEFYRLLNEHRVANGLKELEIDLKLQAYADIRADEQRESFGHTRPDGSAAGSGWGNAHNVMNSSYAENALKTGAIGADPQSAARGIFSIWKNSEGHNKHMLYDFDPQIKMALGIAPRLEENGTVTSGAIFATGYERQQS